MIFNVTSGVSLSAVKALMAPNLLDNSDFRNPIAQAGVGGKHGSVSYAVDRWILDGGTVSLEQGVGLTLNGTIRQKLEHPPADPVSAFVGMVSGEAAISYADGAVTVTSAGGVLQWAALYEGEYTAGTMPPYVPRPYVVERAECMRYFNYMSAVISGVGEIKNIQFPEVMRAKPSVTITSWGSHPVSIKYVDVYSATFAGIPSHNDATGIIVTALADL